MTAAAPFNEQPSTEEVQALLRVARNAIAAELAGRSFDVPELGPPWNRQGNVFVTLRGVDGQLRGCVGRTRPMLPTVLHEIADCAIASATRDTRVPPVEVDELDRLHIEISVLGPPEPVENHDDLDPSRYGVIVSFGSRQGVLLPAIAGIDTVEDQIDIAARKGGIATSAPYAVHRFEVMKITGTR